MNLSNDLFPFNFTARLEKLRQNIDVSKRGAGDKNEPATVELLILVDNSVYRRFAAKHGERGAMRQIEKHYTILAHIVRNYIMTIGRPPAYKITV